MNDIAPLPAKNLAYLYIKN